MCLTDTSAEREIKFPYTPTTIFLLPISVTEHFLLDMLQVNPIILGKQHTKKGLCHLKKQVPQFKVDLLSLPENPNPCQRT
jgi:hypothetical protein